MKKLSEMTDEERYGKVGAEIRRLDPEAYKNRPKTAEGNMKLLRELREKANKAPVNFMTEGRKPTVDFKTEGRTSSESTKTDDLIKQRAEKLSEPTKGGPTARRNPRSSSKDTASDEPKPTRRSSGSSPYSSVLERYRNMDIPRRGYKKGGSVKSSASRRADGIAKKGKTRGKMI